MSKRTFWQRDWVFALLVVLLLLPLLFYTSMVDVLDGKAYDYGMARVERTPSSQIAIIAIDDKSIQTVGRWPWPRDIGAKVIDKLGEAQARTVVNSVYYLEPQIDPGMAYFDKLSALTTKALQNQNRAAASMPEQAASDAPPAPPAPAVADLKAIQQVLRDAEKALNVDKTMSDSLAKAKNTVLIAGTELALPGESLGNPPPQPEWAQRQSIGQVIDRGKGAGVLQLRSMVWPIDSYGRFASGIGHSTYLPDPDGLVRREALYLKYGEAIYPSLSLIAATRQLNLSAGQIQVELGNSLQLGNQTLQSDTEGGFRPLFYANTSFPVDSFIDVYNGIIPAEKYRGKIVLIGPTAAGLGDSLSTPSGTMPPVLALAHSVSSLLQGDVVREPEWAQWAPLAGLLVIAVFLVAVLPHLGAAVGAILTLLLLAGLVGGELYLMQSQLQWVKLMAPACLLVPGYLLISTRRFLFSERGKAQADAESAESNRMLGLAFQGQGQLDLAFDKFRKCPIDDTMMDTLYTLALDFERKRQFNKSLAVFQYMSGYNAKYKDLPQRLARAQQMSETVILGGSGSHGAAGTLITAGAEKPMLGRYQVEKELGKGAMGVVYFGRDPKIGRTVAIKTMALSQEFEAEELDEARARFFREAETAGRLNHPNIVTIYDAGEEHDLAYIAMEFLKGKDLADQIKPDHLLPMPTVMQIIAKVADALNYAHSQSVVHRDIKPANIMYEPDQHTVKVTDFGIARITDSSRTKTGMVLGTPSYMSPEQLSGKKIDGRSDLFSLGVTLYQMLCGHLPFHGDSMAELMFRIANDPPRDITQFNNALPLCVLTILNKALQKDVERRYQSGAELAAALQQCLAECGHA
ncbi:CHASE2 domain-containing serine/threonine-protein kinase [Leeia aquatica]|uniref:non-specific serine/threonine protein kinase n=1 Tax=Leeia aquatica TaxID=2725557 RepID=A0A847RZY2_9NEIS|nr:serine/threonine-protein kinase [Leeia aquatica]NLR75221.1 CHASE2 domain-containing protein [Leeia aquatica]